MLIIVNIISYSGASFNIITIIYTIAREERNSFHHLPIKQYSVHYCNCNFYPILDHIYMSVQIIVIYPYICMCIVVLVNYN